MFELFHFDKSTLNVLPTKERKYYLDLIKKNLILDKRPFFLNEEGIPNRELNDYCNYLIHPCRRSTRTWATYTSQISIFLRFLESQENPKSWLEATENDLKNYYLVRTTGEFQFGTRPLTGRSWNIAKTALVHLYEFAIEEKLIEKLPFRYRKSKTRFYGKQIETASIGAKYTPAPINFITISQYLDFWRPLLTKQYNAVRDLVLTDLLISTGLRISEALSLTIYQIPDPDNAIYAGYKSVKLKVVGKGNKTRYVRVPKRIIRDLHFYIDEDREKSVQLFKRKYKKKLVYSDKVFLSQAGTPLSVRSVESFFKKISKTTEILLTPHGCRHTFAVFQLQSMIRHLSKNLKEMREDGAESYRQIMNDPLRQLQLLLGHSHITSTFIYLQFLEETEALVDESLADWSHWENTNGR